MNVRYTGSLLSIKCTSGLHIKCKGIQRLKTDISYQLLSAVHLKTKQNKTKKQKKKHLICLLFRTNKRNNTS